MLVLGMQTVTISKQEYDALLALKPLVLDLKKQVEELQEQLNLKQHKTYGPSSERAEYYGQLNMSEVFNEMEAYFTPDTPEPTVEEVWVKPHKRKKKSSLKDRLPDDIPVEVIEHTLSDEARTCPCCRHLMEDIGTKVREHLRLIPAKAILERHVQHVYACKCCDEQANDVTVVTAKAPTPVFSGSLATAESIAHIAVQKFVMHAPLYRQEQDWARREIHLSRQTMSNWLVRATKEYFLPVVRALYQDLMTREVLHADETVLQVLKEPGKKAQSKSYMWLYRTSGDTDRPIVLYDYQPDRRQVRPQKYLEHFSGYLHTDGYTAYHNLHDGITNVGCMAHVRRKFDEALKATDKTSPVKALAQDAILRIQQFFRLEKAYQELSSDERYEKRLAELKPLMDDFYLWLEDLSVSNKSAFGRARHYAMTQKFYLYNLFRDGRLELTNNRAERSIKPFVMSRKNFLFANTPNGAKASAILFSLIETAKEYAIDPYDYLVWVLKKAPELVENKELDKVAELTPDNYRRQEKGD